MIQFSFNYINNQSLMASILVEEGLRFSYDGLGTFVVYTTEFDWFLALVRGIGFEEEEEYETAFKFKGSNYDVWGEYQQQSILVTSIGKTPIFFEQTGISEPVLEVSSLDGNLAIKDIDNTYELLKLQNLLKVRKESNSSNHAPIIFGIPKKILRKCSIHLEEYLEDYAAHNLGFLIRQVDEDEKSKLHELYMKEENTFI